MTRPAEPDAPVSAAAGDALVRNSTAMAAGSVLSRLTGIGRDVLLTAAIGLSITADAFTLGNTLPTIVYGLLIGGTLNAVFVPVLVRRMKDDADGGSAYADALLSATLLVLVALTLVAMVAAPVIVALYTTSEYSPDQVQLTVAFTRYCLPQVLFYGVTAMIAQVLNVRGSFGPPMFAPVASNVVAMATYGSFLLVFGPVAIGSTAGVGELPPTQTAWLGIGTTLGIVVQALVLVRPLRRTGFRYRFTTRWRGLGLRHAGRLAGWTIGLVAVTQIGYLGLSRLATAANVNAVAAGEAGAGLTSFAKAYMIFMIPHGIITVSIITALLPGLSRTVHAGRLHMAGREVGAAVRLASSALVPAGVLLFLLAEPVTGLLFGVGGSDAAAAAGVATILRILLVGLLPYSLYYVLQRGFHAQQDTRTPFFLGVLMYGSFLLLAWLLFTRSEPGADQMYAVTAAHVVGSTIAFLAGWGLLRRGLGTLDTRACASDGVRLLAIAAPAAVAAWLLGSRLPLGDSGHWGQVVQIVAVAAVFLLGYAITLRVAAPQEFRQVQQPVRRLLHRSRGRAR
jgi:putative peptidoglycan lipid II flippase